MKRSPGSGLRTCTPPTSTPPAAILARKARPWVSSGSTVTSPTRSPCPATASAAVIAPPPGKNPRAPSRPATSRKASPAQMTSKARRSATRGFGAVAPHGTVSLRATSPSPPNPRTRRSAPLDVGAVRPSPGRAACAAQSRSRAAPAALAAAKAAACSGTHLAICPCRTMSPMQSGGGSRVWASKVSASKPARTASMRCWRS